VQCPPDLKRLNWHGRPSLLLIKENIVFRRRDTRLLEELIYAPPALFL